MAKQILKISATHDYKAEGFSKGKFKTSVLDSGFHHLMQIYRALQQKALPQLDEISVLDKDTEKFARYKVTISVNGNYYFKKQ